VLVEAVPNELPDGPPYQPAAAVRHTRTTPGGATSTESLHIAIDNLTPHVHRIGAAVSVDGGRFADVHNLVVTATTTNPATEYMFRPAGTAETALVCLEIYRRDSSCFAVLRGAARPRRS
jgi:stress response protein SCP2